MSNYQCEVCTKKFAYKQAYDRHTLSHDVEKIVSVTRPRNKTAKMNEYEQEVSKQRKVNPRAKVKLPRPQRQKLHACDECPKSYQRKDHLARHKLYHLGIKSFVCDVCNKAFVRKDKLQRHEMIHLKNSRFPCAVCKKVFYRKDSRKKHMKLHSESNAPEDELPGFPCEVCQEVFLRYLSLEKHMKVHSTSDELKDEILIDKTENPTIPEILSENNDNGPELETTSESKSKIHEQEIKPEHETENAVIEKIPEGDVTPDQEMEPSLEEKDTFPEKEITQENEAESVKEQIVEILML